LLYLTVSLHEKEHCYLRCAKELTEQCKESNKQTLGKTFLALAGYSKRALLSYVKQKIKLDGEKVWGEGGNKNYHEKKVRCGTSKSDCY
jgi:hypothetical protein